MPVLKVKSYTKEFFVKATPIFGEVNIVFSNNSRKTFTLETPHFMALSHLLEHDDVAYDTSAQKFITKKEYHLT
ncbi:MAG: hypothetical protein AAF620_09880 [Bacteroidota bacterium]